MNVHYLNNCTNLSPDGKIIGKGQIRDIKDKRMKEKREKESFKNHKV